MNQRHTIEENSFLSFQAGQWDNFSWKKKTCVSYIGDTTVIRTPLERKSREDLHVIC